MREASDEEVIRNIRRLGLSELRRDTAVLYRRQASRRENASLEYNETREKNNASPTDDMIPED